MYSKGIMWLDDCRIPFVDEKVPRLNVSYEHKSNNNFGGGNDKRHGTSTQSVGEGQGRFSPNLLVCDDMLNDGNVSNSSGGKGEATKNSLDRTDIGFGYKKLDDAPGLGGYGDKGTNSRYYDLDLWFDKMLEGL